MNNKYENKYVSAQYYNSSDEDGNVIQNAIVIGIRHDGNQSIIPNKVGNEEYDFLLAKHNDPDDAFTIAEAD